MGAVAVGATIYFGSAESSRQIVEVGQSIIKWLHELVMATVLWLYTRNSAFKKDRVDYHTAADLSSQANQLGNHTGRHYKNKNFQIKRWI